MLSKGNTKLQSLSSIFLFIIFLAFSWWLMGKSFGIDPKSVMWVARHQVGDFGLHLSLIRSFSWGNNFPPESPFFPGRSLPYHYGFDFLVGMLERAGIRIDYALNGVSVLLFTFLLYLLWKIPQQLFGKNMLLGIISVLLFVFHGGLTFVDFLTKVPLNASILKTLWHSPDYLNAGPFDGSLISIFFTLNVYLNQRHLIAGMVISLSIISILLSYLLQKKEISAPLLVILGVLLGISSRIHTLMFASTVLVIALLFLLFRRHRFFLPFFVPALAIFSFHAMDIVRQQITSISHGFFDPGFLSPRPFSVLGFMWYWWVNMFITLILIPYGYLKTGKSQRYVFFAFASLFVIANMFRLSFRIDHNHSLLNLFFAVANMYTAFALGESFKKGIMGKIAVVGCLILLTASGVIDLMVIKNDFRYPIADSYRAPLIAWIRTHTPPNAIFLAPAELLDPVTLAGRKNYLGNSYFLTVMGYPVIERQVFVQQMFASPDPAKMNALRITHMLVPKKEKQPDNLYPIFETPDAILYAL